MVSMSGCVDDGGRMGGYIPPRSWIWAACGVLAAIYDASWCSFCAVCSWEGRGGSALRRPDSFRTFVVNAAFSGTGGSKTIWPSGETLACLS